MHTIDNDCWCHVCAQAKAEYRLRADRAEERLAELARDLALMTHSRDDFRAAVIAGEEDRARAAELEERVRTIAAANGSIAHERDELAARMASVLAHRDALTARLSEMWWAAWCGIWPVVGHGMEVWEYDGHWERRLAAVEAERDAAHAALEDVTRERDALLIARAALALPGKGGCP